MLDRERALRRRLAVPDDAQRVLVLGETSHWDPNWLKTSEEYYRERIGHIFHEVLTELEKDERRVFALESVFFLRMHWQRRPADRQAIRHLMHAGRLRLTGSGITTPDTVLPPTEAIMRDFLLGQEWLRAEGLEVEPRLVYLPDDFGYSPALPGLFDALGYDRIVITRIDGMYFIGSDLLPRSAFPTPGSSAWALEREHRTADFMWRGPDGVQVLTHWNAFTYFMGDMLASLGIIRWMGRTYGVHWRTDRHIARRIDGYVEQLAPMALTPYLFCPIGCDFNGPIPDLMQLVDAYNRRRYPDSGVWVVSAGVDDYLDLVEASGVELPVVGLDPNPYWMGFYATRAEAKQRMNRTVRKLVLAEALEVEQAILQAPVHVARDERVAQAWDGIAFANHHDFVTGTSPDRVWEAEQRPVLEDAEALADAVLAEQPDLQEEPGEGRVVWSLADHRLTIDNGVLRLVLDEVHGGTLLSLARWDGENVLAGPGNDLVSYRDTGGLWRLGHEFRGGVFREEERVATRPARFEVLERGDALTVRVQSRLHYASFERWIHVRADDPVVRMRVVGRAPEDYTVTCRFPLAWRPDHIAMNVPGGIVSRPPVRQLVPTFWPARSFAHVRCPDTDLGFAVFLGGPAAVSLSQAGVLEWMVGRHARRERAFGVLPIFAHPIGGSELEVTELAYAIDLTRGGDALANELPQAVRHALDDAPWGATPRAMPTVFEASHPAVTVAAVKAASRGTGVVVRLHRHDNEVGRVKLACAHRPIVAAWRCDGRERDLEALVVAEGQIEVALRGAVTSVRVEV
ncbi:MAG: hypothetical protein KC933_13775 [Myxococcales bacterium]|nr:hypothetical protein [Myxococcales bacterium]MCB9647469.1 hypothetical protein [Deltaproteobacteria bacterium]